MLKEPAQKPQMTLGDVLYAKSNAPVPEQDWAVLVHSIAAGDQFALHALYERAHRAVFTLIMRITANRETAEELTVDVFHDVWRRAGGYDPANGTVLGWIMNQARSRAIDRLRFDSRKKRCDDVERPALPEPAADPQDVLELREQADALRKALTALTPDERQAIEATFFAGLTHAEAARGLKQPLGTVKTRIRSGLHKLRQRVEPRKRGSHECAVQSCAQSQITCAYAARCLAGARDRRSRRSHRLLPACQREADSLRPVVDRFIAWPTDVLRPPASLQARLAAASRRRRGEQPVLPPAPQWREPDWEQVAPGIECKLLATDTERHRVSMLVRLAPGCELSAAYPCRGRRTAPARRRTLDRRAQALSRRLQLWRARRRRRACLERDRLHLRPHHQHQGYAALKVRAGASPALAPTP